MRSAVSPKGLAKLHEENEGEEITLRKPKSNGGPQISGDSPLVIDIGTYSTKIGFASSEISSSGSKCLPSVMVPTMVGVTKLLPGKISDGCK